jgi:penicillin-binding protein 2
MWDALAEALGVSRAEIDDRCRAIEEDVERLARAIWAKREEARAREMSRQRELSTEIATSEGPDLRTPIAEQQSPHAIATAIDEATAFRVRRVVDMYEGLTLDSSGARTYPMETVIVDIDVETLPPPLRADPATPREIAVRGLATHILGWMRPVYREDAEKRPRIDPATGAIDRGHYQIGDRAGSTGVEASQERVLRGQRGSIIRHRDTGVEEVTPPIAGRDVTLTIDAALQARIHAAMDPDLGVARVQPWHATKQGLPMMGLGAPIRGAAVVIDIDTAEILAMVSTPSFERAALAANPASIWEDPVDAPWVNRAIGRPYEPGSPIKPLILAAACTQGVHHVTRAIECNGHLYPDRADQFRCWVFKQFDRTHGPLGAVDALSVSCNIYFYTLGRALGPRYLPDWLARFGIGRPLDLGAGAEFVGIAAAHADGTPISIGEAILIGIGQGPVAWTPVHAADVYATLARGGLRMAPHILKDSPPKPDDLHLDPSALDAIFEGLRSGVEDESGTSNHIDYPTGREKIITVPGVTVLGKTGTATASPIVGKGPDGTVSVLRSGDHAWMLALVGKEGQAPRYAIAVIMEFAGSGGRVAGPIADQVIWALRAEGYL